MVWTYWWLLQSNNQSEIIQNLSDDLDNGADINHAYTFHNSTEACTMLEWAIIQNCNEAVKYVLRRGANIAYGRIGDSDYRNALELAILMHVSYGHPNYPILKMLKEQSLRFFSSYGVTALHIDCAIEAELSNDKTGLGRAQVNATVSTDSPLWPGMTPLLIAAKHEKIKVVKRLLDLGADPDVSDPEGNTPLQYLFKFHPYFHDERLFTRDKRDAYITYCHSLHNACLQCPAQAVNVVKRYLDQGFSPDLLIAKNGQTGLHIAVMKKNIKLIHLLLQHGASSDIKDKSGCTPIDYCSINYPPFVECSCLYIEAGLNMGKIDESELFNHLPKRDEKVFLEFIIRLMTRKADLVSENLFRKYLFLSSTLVDDWNETEYAARCSEEFKALSDLGLSQILDDTTVSYDFEHTFRRLKYFDFESYPIYGSLLQIRSKIKYREYEVKLRNIRYDILKLRELFKNISYTSAERILWNHSFEEITRISEQQQLNQKSIEKKDLKRDSISVNAGNALFVIFVVAVDYFVNAVFKVSFKLS